MDSVTRVCVFHSTRFNEEHFQRAISVSFWVSSDLSYLDDHSYFLSLDTLLHFLVPAKERKREREPFLSGPFSCDLLLLSPRSVSTSLFVPVPPSMSEAEPDDSRERREIPVSTINVFAMMEDVVDKLKLMNYEQEYCATKDQPPLNRAAFSIATANQATQFHAFVDLVGWLFQKCRVSCQVDWHDDNTTSCNNIYSSLREMQFQLDFPASKLRTGSGDACVQVLSFLCDRGLAESGFKYKRPDYPEEGFADEAEVDAAAEVEADMTLEGDAGGSGDEEEVLYSEMVNEKSYGTKDDDDDEEDREKMESEIDPLIWATELERVRPRLKVPHMANAKEWRTHIEQSKQHGGIVSKTLPEAKRSLARIAEGVKESLESVTSREKYLNNTFQALVADYKEVQDKMTAVKSRQSEAGEKVSDFTNELQDISDQLEEIKSTMDERGSSMTDTSPLVRIKKSLKQLKEEIQEMELRMGVLSHTLMQAKMRHRTAKDAGIESKVSRGADISPDGSGSDEDGW
jgi:intraflagellar transport protein 57